MTSLISSLDTTLPSEENGFVRIGHPMVTRAGVITNYSRADSDRLVAQVQFRDNKKIVTKAVTPDGDLSDPKTARNTFILNADNMLDGPVVDWQLDPVTNAPVQQVTSFFHLDQEVSAIEYAAIQFLKISPKARALFGAERGKKPQAYPTKLQ